ncbi:MAG: hypothetical protein GY774_22900 [Planctomycetes bacterium]|nr:hypothetical protein [Planctomycetota bacterium]
MTSYVTEQEFKQEVSKGRDWLEQANRKSLNAASWSGVMSILLFFVALLMMKNQSPWYVAGGISMLLLGTVMLSFKIQQYLRGKQLACRLEPVASQPDLWGWFTFFRKSYWVSTMNPFTGTMELLFHTSIAVMTISAASLTGELRFLEFVLITIIVIYSLYMEVSTFTAANGRWERAYDALLRAKDHSAEMEQQKSEPAQEGVL